MNRKVRALGRRDFLASLAVAGLAIAAGKSDAADMRPDLSHLTPEERAEFLAMRERMLAALPFDRVTAPGVEALSRWHELRGAGRGVPVVIGNDEQLERIADQFSINDPAIYPPGLRLPPTRQPAEILSAAEELRWPADLSRWPGAYGQEDLRAPLGHWPDGPLISAPGLSVAADLSSGRPHDRVHILLIPAASSWEVPAYLSWGDWNACPPPEYHVAALRSWHARYGAELIGIDGDTLNVRVARRPGTRAEALALAREQYRYCPDIVDQGVGTLSALAAALLVGDWWYFWWD